MKHSKPQGNSATARRREHRRQARYPGWRPGAIRKALHVSRLPPELLARGQERYEIYCVPCHGYAGYGDGIVVKRGFPAPPSYHEPRLRAASDRHLFDVITKGYGVMFSYAARVEPEDRRAIIAYIRALQLSQHASVESLPARERSDLIAAQRGPQ